MTPEPPVATNTPCMLNRRYEYVRTIGRGGMGEVFLVRDRQLQRDLALKVLTDLRAAEPAFVDRFVEEAQIAAQLQHPGIVPIHDIGKLDDQRPYFTMKLVKGKTLDSLLAQRKGMNDSLDRWLNVFLQVCQAVAYAHSKGVIHRDLKPSNIMVDRFGEVQVMDWGLAKILSYSMSQTSQRYASTSDDDQPARSTRAPLVFHAVPDPESSLPYPTIIRSIRCSPSDEEFPSTQRGLEWRTESGSLTSQGYVMGTVAFMPPEQARGCVDQLDSRCDVFALGAILCVILTGKPPYYSESDADRFQMATKGDLADCFERLRAAPFDNALIELAIHCLCPDPAGRPKDAAAAAAQLAEHLAKVRQRLHQAELESAEAAAKLEAAVQARRIEKQRQRWVRATAVSIGASIVLGLASLAWIRQQESDLRLAVSNQKLASMEREQERSERIDQSKLALERIAAPMRLQFEQITDSEQIPTHAQLQQLASYLAQTQSAFDGADREVRQQWDLASWQRRLERLRFLAQLCQELPGKMDQEWIANNLAVDFSQEDPAAALAECLQNLPRWANEHLAVAVGTSAYQHDILPRDWVEKVHSSELEKSLWSAIGQTDWPRLIELALEDSFDSLPLATQLFVAQILVETGPSDMAAWANTELEWVVMRPTEARNEWQAPIPVSEDGWIEVGQVGGTQYRMMIDVPAIPMNLFRIETYCGPRLPVIKDSLETEEQSDEAPSAFLRTAPTAQRIEETSDRVGPGLAGEGPDYCLIREIRFSRVQPNLVPAKLLFSRVYSGHTTIPGREADFALDQKDGTYWALGHPESLPWVSTFFETRPVPAAQLHPSLLCEIDSGDFRLWQGTALGRFRLYYAKEPTLPEETYTLAAEQILKRLNRRYPANSRILGLQAQIGMATGLLERRNRVAALVLASTAASIDGFDIAALKLLTEMTLALHPAVENPSYQQLMDQVQSVSGSRAASEATNRIALYQRERGERMFSLHPATSLEAYSEAERIDPVNFNRHGRLAWELFRSKRKDEAMSMARKGVSGENCQWEDLFYFGNIAIRSKHIQEAWTIFEQRMQAPELWSNSQLRLLHGRLAFLNGFAETGIQILEELGSTIDESPAIISAAAQGLATSEHRSRLPWLLKFWQQYDGKEISKSPEFIVHRDRRQAWGTLAFAAIDAGYEQELKEVLTEHSKSHKQLLNEIAISMDQLLFERTPPQSIFIDRKNSRKLIDVYRAIEPNEPRWKIRAAVLAWLQGQNGEAFEILESLPFDQSGNGDGILRSSPGRIWQAMARVCLATFRLLERVDLELDAEPELDAEYEIEAAQKCLGRVPQGDRDLAEWLWWEYRLRSMPKVSAE